VQAGLPLLELRTADDADLEHLFLSLTSPATTLTAEVTR
jgi:hypothetical protein